MGSLGPLAGVRVLGLEHSVAGPLATRLLADMGAEVVKVEAAAGDFARHWDHHVYGHASHFTWLSRRKQSISLNLHDAAEREILWRLIEQADVLVTNMSCAAAERLALTPASLSARFPRLISCQITGYGRTGPLKDRKAYDMLVQAEAGLMDLTGGAEGPSRIGVSVCDVGTGIYATTLILAALYERQTTGKGRAFDVSMFEAMAEFVAPNLTAFANAGIRYERNRSRHHAIVPYGIFECADGPLALAIEHDDEWRTFTNQILQRPDLDCPEYATNPERVEHRVQVETAVEKVLLGQPRAYWSERLDRAGLAYGSVNEIGQVWNHPVSSDRGLHRRVVLPDGVEANVPTSLAERVFDRADSPAAIPALDGDRASILADLRQRDARAQAADPSFETR
jgi:formyl-CoA transferase